MIAIKNDSHTRQVFFYTRAESSAHIHGNRLERAQAFQMRAAFDQNSVAGCLGDSGKHR